MGYYEELLQDRLDHAVRLLRQVSEPLEYDPLFSDFVCIECGAEAETREDITHKPDCLWLDIKDFLLEE